MPKLKTSTQISKMLVLAGARMAKLSKGTTSYNNLRFNSKIKTRLHHNNLTLDKEELVVLNKNGKI